MLCNLLTRYALISILDVMMLVFISLSAASSGVFEPHQETINIAISYLLIGLFGFFFLLIAGHGVWRFRKVKNADVWADFDVSGYVCTLYEGMNIHHPENTTVY